MGLGYVTSRDFVSFLRNAVADDAGNPNPAAGVDTALCVGISSSGMYSRSSFGDQPSRHRKLMNACGRKPASR